MYLQQFDDAYIVKPRGLIHAVYNLNLGKLRLILACFAQMDTRGDVEDTYFIRAADYMKMYGLASGNAYSELREAAEALWEETITIYPGQDRELKRRWIISVDYYHGEGHVCIRFHPDIVPHFGQLKEHFTRYRYRNVWHLKSFYGLRLYEYLIENAKFGHRVLDVEQIKTEFNLKNKYARWSDFYQRVIDDPIKAINKATNIRVHTVEKRKIGREVAALKFIYDVGPDLNISTLDTKETRKLQLELFDAEEKPLHPFRETEPVALKADELIAARKDFLGIMKSINKHG